MKKPPCLCLLRPALVALAALWLNGPAAAADIRWSSAAVRYTAVEPKDLRVFLREFAAQQSMAISIDPEVKGELTGRYNLSPGSMMEFIARTYGLVYYFDGKVLHVSPSTSVSSEIFSLNEGGAAQFQRTLDRLGISDSRYPLTIDPDRNTVMVSGPKRFVELVRQAAAVSSRRTENAPPPDQAPTSTRVFQLRYAFADDYIVRSGGRDYRVPGVVTILRQTFAHSWRAGAAPSTSRQVVAAESPAPGNAPLLPVLQGQRRATLGAASGAPAPAVDEQPSMAGSAAVTLAPASLPAFSADSRTNAIIVRDIPSRLVQYEELIRELDERPRMVELEVNVIEVNSDDFKTLGVDWRLLGSEAAFEVGGGNLSARVTNPSGAFPDPRNPLSPGRTIGNAQGAVFALVTGGRSALVARISALEQGGRATVRAQPRVLTLNNVEAVLESMNTLYVRVEGFQDAQLFDINVGTAIRLTPSVAESALDPALPDDKKQLVRMLVRIEDGSISDQMIDRVPVIQRSNISTQAVVIDGSTLLIAGYSQERTREVRNDVPVLSKIPLVGGLFSSKSNTQQRLERLFMITPRVVDLASAVVSKPAPIGVGPEQADPARLGARPLPVPTSQVVARPRVDAPAWLERYEGPAP